MTNHIPVFLRHDSQTSRSRRMSMFSKPVDFEPTDIKWTRILTKIFLLYTHEMRVGYQTQVGASIILDPISSCVARTRRRTTHRRSISFHGGRDKDERKRSHETSPDDRMFLTSPECSLSNKSLLYISLSRLYEREFLWTKEKGGPRLRAILFLRSIVLCNLYMKLLVAWLV